MKFTIGLTKPDIRHQLIGYCAHPYSQRSRYVLLLDLFTGRHSFQGILHIGTVLHIWCLLP